MIRKVQTRPILECIKEFYEALFKKGEQKTMTVIKSFLSHINIPKLYEYKANLCEENVIEKDLYNSLKSMQNDKSPGNDRLIKEFYETFWNELKKIFINSVSETKEKGHSSASQRQAIIRLIEKKDKDKRFIQNWLPISLLTVDLKIMSKALSENLKKFCQI